MNNVYMNHYIQQQMKCADMCWSAFKAQLNTHNPNKQEVDKLKRAMISFVENLAVVSKGNSHFKGKERIL